MKFEDLHLVSVNPPSNVHRFVPIEITLRTEPRVRFLAVFLFGQGIEFVWSVNCHCLGCRLDRIYKVIGWFRRRPFTHEEILDTFQSMKDCPRKDRLIAAWTQHHYRAETLKNAQEKSA